MICNSYVFWRIRRGKKDGLGRGPFFYIFQTFVYKRVALEICYDKNSKLYGIYFSYKNCHLRKSHTRLSISRLDVSVHADEMLAAQLNCESPEVPSLNAHLIKIDKL